MPLQLSRPRAERLQQSKIMKGKDYIYNYLNANIVNVCLSDLRVGRVGRQVSPLEELALSQNCTNHSR